MKRDHPRLPTRVGHAGFTEPRFFGHAVYAELAGQESLMGLAALAATGHRLPADDCRVLDDIAAVMTVADPRIWPLKATRLGSSYGNPMAGVAVGCLCMASPYVGPAQVPPAAARLFVALAAAVRGRPDPRAALARALEQHAHLPGFGVPGRAKDERLPALRACLERRAGRHRREHWRLFEQTAELVRTSRGLEPNISAGIGAAGLDLGLAPEELGLICTLIGLGLVLPNAFEGARQRPPALQALPLRFVHYAGRSPRTSPRARRAAGAP